MSNPNPFEVAALPSLINAVTAVKTFFNSLGTDPAKIAVNLPGASQVLLGTLELQLVPLAGSEIGAVNAVVNQRLDSLLASLEAKLPPK